MNPKSLTGVTFLANAEMKCSDQQLLSGFQFESLNNRRFRYNYECTNFNQELTEEEVSNPWTDYLGWHPDSADSNGDVNFLDRQNIDCSGKGFLATIQMEVDFDGEFLRYIYTCKQPTSLEIDVTKCEDRRTTSGDAENYFLPSLRYHHVSCGVNEAMKSFQLQVDYDPPGGHVWYNFSCCRLDQVQR